MGHVWTAPSWQGESSRRRLGATVFRQIARWVDDYNESHPHSGLGMVSPREFIRAQARWPGGRSNGGTPPRLFPPLGRQRMPKAAKCEPFSFAHLIVRLGFIYLLCIASMFLSVLAVNLIPNDVILKHLRESLPTENYRVLFGATNTDQH